LSTTFTVVVSASRIRPRIAALAAPVAVVGAMIGEFFGASRGLGVLVISAMDNFQIPLLWSAAILSVGCSLLAYAILTLLQRRVRGRFA
jgi:NitT/TauT family transport system permease protein